MANPARIKDEFVLEDDDTVLFYVDSDNNRTPVDITGRTYVCSIGGRQAPLLADTATVTGASGLATFVFTKAAKASAGLTVADYVTDIVETTNGAESTLVLGVISMVSRVTL